MAITAADKKILAELEKTKRQINAHIDEYAFGQSLHKLYDFFWHNFCDEYIEESKRQLADEKFKKTTEEILIYILLSFLKLLHPFMPFITEEIWQQLPIYPPKFSPGKFGRVKNKNLLMIEKW